MTSAPSSSRDGADEKAWAVVRAILQRGNDAVIRKKGDGYVVLEDKREIKYTKENRPG